MAYTDSIMSSMPVTLAYAQSLDGRIATASGDSQWISGEETLALSQELRRDHGAVAVGINTVLRDDCLLTCRLPGSPNPLRVVFDSRLRMPASCRIALTARETKTLLFCALGERTSPEGAERGRALEAAGVRIVELPRAHDQPGLRLAGALEAIGELGIDSLLVEGGSALLTSFLRARLATRLVVVTAPIFIGRGIAAIGDLGVDRLTEALRPRKAAARTMGADVVWELEL
jgi:5-amino-6-(5-phosphoribosylamino)uracil reductase/diaminohydroxyphosphoribosylaminopyrimidine deaminase/5-amino-6-(5-phosphoribosylamino)uracil reductase